MPKTTCSVQDCAKPTRSLGWCDNHYRKMRRRGLSGEGIRERAPLDSSPAERLKHTGWTIMASGCWEWNGGKREGGYGHMNLGGGRWSTASRVSFELRHGPITDPALCVLHRCDNPPCINPDHLFLGTRTDNSDDKGAKGRTPNGERSKHKLTDDEVAAIRNLWDGGGRTQVSIAMEFGVTGGHVSQIVHHLTRKEPTRLLPSAAG